MSALDQAFIRAYAPEEPPVPPAASAPADAAVEAPGVDHEEPPSETPEAAEDQPATTGAQGAFRPLLQVDRFAWPEEATRLGRAASEILEALTDELLTTAEHGGNVVALGNCHRGDGATTVLVCIARCLAGRGLKAVMVDADFRRPRLARRLGILPQAGWEEVLSGRTPLGEAVVESIEDRLALLPLREPSDSRSDEAPASGDPTSSLAALGRHYDVVLLDLGSCRREHRLLVPQTSSNPWIDRLLLVRNVQSTPSTDLAEVCRRVRSAGIAEVGVVENFV